MAHLSVKQGYSMKSFKTERVCIYPKDVQRITGKSEKSGQRLFRKIRKEGGKKDHQFITTNEFAEYSGIAIDLIKEYLVD